MGGPPASEPGVTAYNTGVFEGTVWLANDGGFASVRTYPEEFGLGGSEGLVLRVKGDEKRYSLRVRTDPQLEGVASSKPFDAAADERVAVKTDFENLAPISRGPPVPDAPPLDSGRIMQIGFLIPDKQEGPFRLEINSISAYPAGSQRKKAPPVATPPPAFN